MDFYEITTKLIGEIKPVGETNEDSDRLNNLEETILLVSSLLNDIIEVSYNTNRYEKSMKIAGERAKNYIVELSKCLKEYE